MSKLVAQGAALKCSHGSSPAQLAVPAAHATTANHAALATITDYVPITNVPAFGMCDSTQNPQVASATAAASGTLARMPCVPVISAPWSPGSQRMTIDHVKVLTDDSTCSCAWSGTVSISDAAAHPTES